MQLSNEIVVLYISWLYNRLKVNIFCADVNLMDQRPSVIASAAILAAFDATLTRNAMDHRISVISSWGNIESVSLFSSVFMFFKSSYLDKEKKKNRT